MQGLARCYGCNGFTLSMERVLTGKRGCWVCCGLRRKGRQAKGEGGASNPSKGLDWHGFIEEGGNASHKMGSRIEKWPVKIVVVARGVVGCSVVEKVEKVVLAVSCSGGAQWCELFGCGGKCGLLAGGGLCQNGKGGGVCAEVVHWLGCRGSGSCSGCTR